MAVQSPPYALQNSSQHSAALFRQAASANVLNIGVLGGLELAVTAQSTPNMTVQVAGGRAWIAGTQVSAVTGQVFSTQACYFALNDAPVTVTIAAADPTNPRIDVVYIGVQDSFYSGSNNASIIGVVTGTPGATPAVPALPNNAYALAQVAVAANTTAITSGNITDKRAGSISAPQLYTCTSSTRPSGVWPGFEIYETDTGNVSLWTGAAWVPLSGTAGGTAISPASGWGNLGGGYAQLQGFRMGNLAVVYGVVTNTNLYSAGPFTVATLPTALRPAKTVMVHGAVQVSGGTAVQSARFDVGSNGNLLVYAPNGVSVAANSFHTLTAVYNVNNV